jgi:hypothetical protein
MAVGTYEQILAERIERAGELYCEQQRFMRSRESLTLRI